MGESTYFTVPEQKEFLSAYRALWRSSHSLIGEDDFKRIREMITGAIKEGNYLRDKNGVNVLLRNINTALILSKEVGLERSTLIAVLIYNLVSDGSYTQEQVEDLFGTDIAKIIRGLIKANSLYAKQ